MMRIWLGTMIFLVCWFESGTAFAVELRDPTQPGSLRADQDDASPLSQIIIGKDRRIAVIHGQFVQVGSIVEGAKVIRIEPYYIELDGPGGKQTLFLFNQQIKHLR